MRWRGRSPGIDSTELTDEVADRSGSDDPGCLETLPVPGLGVGSADSIISGDCDSGGGFEEGGAGNGAFAMREMGDRPWEGDGLALEGGDTGLWDEGDSSCKYVWGRELVFRGDGEIWREPGGPGRDATSDRAPG